MVNGNNQEASSTKAFQRRRQRTVLNTSCSSWSNYFLFKMALLLTVVLLLLCRSTFLYSRVFHNSHYREDEVLQLPPQSPSSSSSDNDNGRTITTEAILPGGTISVTSRTANDNTVRTASILRTWTCTLKRNAGANKITITANTTDTENAGS